MAIYAFKDFVPKLEKDAWVAEDATLIGQAHIGEGVNIWFQSVVRADVNEITIGAGTNVQDLSMLHVTEDLPLIIGKGVSIGHNAILHACEIEDHCLIGMGAIILDGAKIQAGSLVAAGSVVPPGKTYPPRSLIMGNPGKVVRQLDDDQYQSIAHHYKSYLGYAREFETKLKRVD